VVDREAPTPRLTSTWKVHEEYAHAMSERLRAMASACGIEDTLRSRRLRDLSDAAETYARTFKRWETSDVDAMQKMRERAAFSLFAQCVEEELKNDS